MGMLKKGLKFLMTDSIYTTQHRSLKSTQKVDKCVVFSIIVRGNRCLMYIIICRLSS